MIMLLKSNRLSSIPTSSRRSSDHLSSSIGRQLRLLSILEGALSPLRPIRLSHLPPRSRPHCTTNLILHLLNTTSCRHHRWPNVHQLDLHHRRLRTLLPNPNIRPTSLGRRSSHARRPRFRRGIYHDPLDWLASPSSPQRQLLRRMVHICLLRGSLPLQASAPIFYLSLRSPERVTTVEHADLPWQLWFRRAIFTHQGPCGWWKRRWRKSHQHDLH